MVNKYIILSMDDMVAIVALLATCPPEETSLIPDTKEKLESIRKRFIVEKGGALEDIARVLKKMPTCERCSDPSLHPNVENGCAALRARELGRRLGRLIRRARPDGKTPSERG